MHGTYLKQATWRSPAWLKAVSELEYCVQCGRHGVQAAHRNEGKGGALKTDDMLTAALCPPCHSDIDQGRHMSREERRANLDRAIVLTLRELVRTGRVGLL